MDKKIIFETADKLEKICKKRHAHNFYHDLSCGKKIINFHDLDFFISSCKLENVEFNPIQVSLDEMIEFSKNFFKRLDESFYYKLENVLNDKFFVHDFEEPNPNFNAGSIGFDWNKKGEPINGLIVLHPMNNLQGYVVVTHEFSHLLESRNQNKIKQKTDCLGEIASLFIENLFIDYMKEIDFITEEQKIMLYRKKFMSFLHNIVILYEEKEILSQLDVPIRGEQLALMEEKYRGTKRGEILKRRIMTMIEGDCGCEVYGERQYRYVIGGIVGDLLYKDLKKDPKQTLDKFKIYIEKNADLDEKQAFELLLGENYNQKISNFLHKNEMLK